MTQRSDPSSKLARCIGSRGHNINTEKMAQPAPYYVLVPVVSVALPGLLNLLEDLPGRAAGQASRRDSWVILGSLGNLTKAPLALLHSRIHRSITSDWVSTNGGTRFGVN